MAATLTVNKSTAIGGFRIIGISPEASAKPLTDLLSSLQPSDGRRYLLEVLACSVPDQSSIKGKGVEVYVCIIQHTEYNYAGRSALRRRLDTGKEILEYNGYRISPVSSTQMVELHNRIVSNCRYSAATRDSQKDASSISGDLDQVISSLINNAEPESEVFSILMWPHKETVRINTAVFADRPRRISLIAKSFNMRLKIYIEQLRVWKYLEKRLSHLCERRDVSAYCRENLPGILPTYKTDSLTDYLPAQPQCLGVGVLDNNDGINLGIVANRHFTPPVDYLYNMAIVGRSGSGKTSFLGSMIDSLNMKGVHFVVIDLFDCDFRGLAEKTNAAVFTMGQETSLQLNPFAIDGLSDCEIREFAKDYIMTTLALGVPLDSFILQAMREYYKTDVSRDAEHFRSYALHYYKLKNTYGPKVGKDMFGVLDARLMKLHECMTGKKPFQSASLLRNNSIVELAGIGSVESRAMVVSYILRLLLVLKKKAYKSGRVSPTFVLIDEVSVLTDVSKSDINVAAQGLQRFLLDVIKFGRKYGFFLIIATQEMRGFECYFEQCHIKLLMNSQWTDSMGNEFAPYRKVVNRLGVGSAICSMPEIQKAFIFKALDFNGFNSRWSDDMILVYMKRRFPEYVSDGETEDMDSDTKPEMQVSTSTTIIDIAKSIIKYVIEKLSETDMESVKRWKESLHLREFIQMVLRKANLSDISVSDVCVEMLLLASKMKEPDVMDFLKEQL